MEIKPQELRLGNIIQREVWGEGVVTKIGPDGFVTIQPKKLMGEISCTCIELSGIELTPEWLERAKFQLVDETMASGVEGIKGPYYAKDALLLWSNGSEPKSAYLVFYADGFFGKYKAVQGRWISTVHDLQNTYHAWKGEELAIDKQI